jgi:hypothetical protein
MVPTSAEAPEIDGPPRLIQRRTRARTLFVSELAMTYVDEYRAGACNIGPAEIARRRLVGHVGAAVTAALVVALAWADAPAWLRVVVFVPAAVSVAGYLQAATRFCADYGWRGVFNFGEAGHDRVEAVASREARRADRRKAMLIGAGSALVGAAVTVLAILA